MKLVKLLPIAASVLLMAACNNENAENKAAENQNEQKFDSTDVKKDVDFAMEAASGGMMEVELGTYAAQNAMDPKVKEFGRSMVMDHQKANDELKAMAAQKNITLPTTPNADMQKKIDDLKQKKGADFDKDYMDLMVSDHKDDIDHFQKEANDGKDGDMKAWAGGKVPVLQHHLEMAQATNDALKAKK